MLTSSLISRAPKDTMNKNPERPHNIDRTISECFNPVIVDNTDSEKEIYRLVFGSEK